MFAFDKDKINNYAKAYGVKIKYNWNKDIDGYEFQLEKGMWKEMFIISRLDLDRSNVPESYFYEHVFMHIRDISKAGYTLEGLLLEILEPYGITKFNYKEYVDRLRFVHYDKPYGKLMTDTQTAVFLDGRFIFCIIKHFDYETDRFGKMSFKYNIEVRHNRRDC